MCTQRSQMSTRFIILCFTLTPILGNNLESYVIKGNNQFAADVYKEISTHNNADNFVVSPFSAETVLALALTGARGQTHRDLQLGLHLPHDKQQTAISFRKIISNIKNKNYDFHTANKIYLKSDFVINEFFKTVAREAFGADVDEIDFSQRQQAAGVMNKWVEEQTNSKIRNLISPDKLSAATRAILINALYFKANWSHPFRKLTKGQQRNFLTPNGPMSVNVMTKNDDDQTYNYAEDADLRAQFLELPFQGGDASMVFVLPFSQNGIVDLERQIDKVLAPQRFHREYVNMTIPKFKFETQIDFKKILQNLGVRQPFSPGDADFTDISPDKLHLSEVIQKTFIDVHESGVEAASATYAGLVLLSIQSTPEPKQFNVDHPFIFYIKVQDLVIFVGRIMTPHI